MMITIVGREMAVPTLLIAPTLLIPLRLFKMEVGGRNEYASESRISLKGLIEPRRFAV